MRLFQNNSLYPGYVPRLRSLEARGSDFTTLRDTFLGDRYAASHILQPVLAGADDAFFANGNDPVLQRQWARERGMSEETSLQDILLAQIEEHRTEVFYNLDPVLFPTRFLERLPGHVRRKIGWRAAPLGGADLSSYDLIVSNFPGILASWRSAGFATAPFFPAHDPEFDGYAHSTDRPVDVIFTGSYSRHHIRRSGILNAVASLSDRFNVNFRLDRSRITRLAESPFGLLPPLAKHARPAAIRRVSGPPVFGRQLYEGLGSAKIVVNCAIDMAGEERGNMRCFEALGAGALLLSDEGVYPAGMIPGETMVTFQGVDDVCGVLERLLALPAERTTIAAAGAAAVRTEYSKERQWRAFQALL